MTLISPARSLTNATTLLQQVWGYPSFRNNQEAIVQTLIQGRDAMVVMPTGGGKSLCFQVPALVRSGLTIVISPLLALMENQVQDLKKRGINAACLHSQQARPEYKQILHDLTQHKLKLLYVSPETLLSPPVWQRLLDPRLTIGLLVLDEAHCLSAWGDSFRPAYFRLGPIRQALLKAKPPGTQFPVAAFTATADPETATTIAQILHLQNPVSFCDEPYRPNLQLKIQRTYTKRDRRSKLLKALKQQSKTSGLIYVRSREESEDLAQWLQRQGYRTSAYHAGMSPSYRRRVEQDWLTGIQQFCVCTNAFGMGIDKPDVRWVFHYHLPNALSEYLQEIGRAGRDGKPAYAMALASERTGWIDSDDRDRWAFFQTQAHQLQIEAAQLVKKLPSQGEMARLLQKHQRNGIALALLQRAGLVTWPDPFNYKVAPKAQFRPQKPKLEMPKYLNHRGCRWGYLRAQFGFAAALDCGHCDRCCSTPRSEVRQSSSGYSPLSPAGAILPSLSRSN
jgi:ATP-dependent DNA helicase RecQ